MQESELTKELKNIFSEDEVVRQLTESIKLKGVDLSEVVGVYERFNDDNDFGIILFDGQKMKIDLSVFSSRTKLVTGVVMTSLKVAMHYAGEFNDSLLGIYDEFNRKNIAEARGAYKRLDMAHGSGKATEQDVYHLLEKLEPVFATINEYIDKVEDYDKRKLQLANEKYARFQAATSKLIQMYFAGINLSIQALITIGEYATAQKICADTAKWIEERFKPYDIQVLKGYDKDFYQNHKTMKDDHEIWDVLISKEKKALDNLTTGRCEYRWIANRRED